MAVRMGLIRRGLRVCLVGVVVCAAVVLPAPAAAAPVGWRIQPAAGPRAASGDLSAVSCVSATWCMGVGAYVDTGGFGRAIAMVWNGTAWSLRATPLPGGAFDTAAFGVSCLSAASCVAVGGSDAKPFAMRWNGTAWTVMRVPGPTFVARAALNAVSCTSAAACVAVGTSYGPDGGDPKPFTALWNGTGWSLKNIPAPVGAVGATLLGVSCPRAGMCLAVGFYLDAHLAPKMLSLTWNGTRWRLLATPSPGAASSPVLIAVSCASVTSCLAVGGDLGVFGGGASVLTVRDIMTARSKAVRASLAAPAGRSGARPALAPDATMLALVWNGTSWASKPPPAIPGSVNPVLTGVSCSSWSACLAVGSYFDDTGNSQPLSLRWTGAAWRLLATPTPSGARAATPINVACTSATTCLTVGYLIDRSENPNTMSMTWTTGRWTPQHTPLPRGALDTSLAGVSCVSATFCVSVGRYETDAFAIGTVAMRWDGTAWTLTPTPAGRGQSVTGVSCVSRTFCLAVGPDTAGGPFAVPAATPRHAVPAATPQPGGPGAATAFAMTWNGTSWTAHPAPAPADNVAINLQGVSCLSVTWCVAVGDSQTPSGPPQDVATVWNGTRWTPTAVPIPAGAKFATLTGVSCVHATACIAVGSYPTDSGQSPWSIEWDGHTWTTKTVPAPPASATTLSAVSCVSSTACVAVGATGDMFGGAGSAFATIWNGVTWMRKPTPQPTDPIATLSDVSCTSATACTAVGNTYTSAGLVHPLTMRWTGTAWTLTAPAQPTPAQDPQLAAVSCTASNACTAVGTYVRLRYMPLIERRS
jgi:hypothetical protein